MANHKSAKTRIRRNNKRAIIAGARRSRVRTFIKKVEGALEAKDKTLALETFKLAEKELMKAVRKNVFHINTASRKISRLSSRIKALG
jgi:small subunit ribosomal protein S20